MKTKPGANFHTETKKPAIEFFNSRTLRLWVKSTWLIQVKVFFMVNYQRQLSLNQKLEGSFPLTSISLLYLFQFYKQNIMDTHEFTLLSSSNYHC